ncbi:hypothetical protein ACIA8K_29580 [Catenuloplanes sp. NPDC051500]|uniref:hypothetical protein n=1 Tax=Catenuloplanes sp. NPDC051500 TaxID=3363959 RepID=UPI00378ADCCD
MLRRFAVFLTALLAVLAGPVPASAAAPAPWTLAPCATAAPPDGIARDSAVGWFVITGGPLECAPTVDGGGVSLVVYRPDTDLGQSAAYQARLFQTINARRGFGIAAMTAVPGEYGVCLLAGEHERITCVRVIVAENRVSATITPLDINDPLVAKEATITPFAGQVSPPQRPGQPNPTCGTCF